MKKKLPSGLCLRGKTYWMDVQIHHRRFRKSLKTRDLKTAKMLLTEICARLQRGEYLVAELPSHFLETADSCSASEVLPKGSYVYFIEAIGLDKIRIGTTNDLKRRLVTLASASPVRLKLLCMQKGGRSLENSIHSMFSVCHAHGDWFFATKDLRDHVTKLCEEGRP